MKRALRGEALPVFGDGWQTRSFSYIRGVAGCIAAAPLLDGARNEVFNVGGDVATSVADLAKTVSSVLGIPAKLELLEERKEVKHAHACHQKLNRVFGAIAADLGLREGLESMAAYVRLTPFRPRLPAPARSKSPTFFRPVGFSPSPLSEKPSPTRLPFSFPRVGSRLIS